MSSFKTSQIAALYTFSLGTPAPASAVPGIHRPLSSEPSDENALPPAPGQGGNGCQRPHPCPICKAYNITRMHNSIRQRRRLWGCSSFAVPVTSSSAGWPMIWISEDDSPVRQSCPPGRRILPPPAAAPRLHRPYQSSVGPERKCSQRCQQSRPGRYGKEAAPVELLNNYQDSATKQNRKYISQQVDEVGRSIGKLGYICMRDNRRMMSGGASTSA